MDIRHPDFRHALTEAVGQWGIETPDSAVAQMESHYRAMVEANRTINLTRITDPVEAAVKHYADSLSLLLWVRDRQVRVTTIIDVGTGAGFPALPLALLRPDWQITAIDGTAKKVAFVRRISESLGLANLDVVHAHSTHWPDGPRADLVLVRAVGRLSKCMQQMAGYVRPGGHLVAYKTPLADDAAELAEARALCAECRFEMKPPYCYEISLRGESLSRALYALQKQPG